MKHRPIIALDFDGVLHSYSSGWRGPGVVSDPPVPEAMPWLWNALSSDLCTIAIFSSRSKSLLGRRAMKRWTWEHLCRFVVKSNIHLYSEEANLPEISWTRLHVNAQFAKISWPWFKPPALVTLDDRAITFTGDFPSLANLLSFKPWNWTAPHARPPVNDSDHALVRYLGATTHRGAGPCGSNDG